MVFRSRSAPPIRPPPSVSTTTRTLRVLRLTGIVSVKRAVCCPGVRSSVALLRVTVSSREASISFLSVKLTAARVNFTLLLPSSLACQSRFLPFTSTVSWAVRVSGWRTTYATFTSNAVNGTVERAACEMSIIICCRGSTRAPLAGAKYPALVTTFKLRSRRITRIRRNLPS